MHRLFLTGLALLLLTGCGSLNLDTRSLDFDLASQPTYYTNALVKRGKPQIMVHPVTPPNRELTALMVPFRMVQASADAKTVGREVSRQFWNVWLGEQVFPVIEFAENAPPYRADVARYLGSSKRAELAIGGQITHYYSGGQTGNSSLSITVEIWDLATGNLLWSIAHSAQIEPGTHSDYIVFRTQNRMPADPMWALIQAVAQDMAAAVKGWSNPHYDSDGQNSAGQQDPSAFGSGPPSSGRAF